MGIVFTDLAATPGTGTYAKVTRPHSLLCNITFKETGGSAGGTLTWYGANDDPSTYAFAANDYQVIQNQDVRRIEATGNGAVLAIYVFEAPGSLDPALISANVIGTPNVNVASQSANLAIETGGNLALLGGTVNGLTVGVSSPAVGPAGSKSIVDLHNDLQSVITLLGAGLPTALSASGNLKVHESGA